jgi:hypothetical protein|tara:strand:+ start:308 stop:469 length:162 start_codon:yes stop_codon:yes gene_type:complete
MDHKQLIGFTEAQRVAISIAAHGAGLSFTAFVRSSAMAKVAEAGIEVTQPQAD